MAGGGARGWAHVGVLRALEEADIEIDYLAGTSIGAMVGAIYVVGALDQLESFASEVSLETLIALIDISFPGLGLIKGEQIQQFISKYLANRKIEDAAIPFRCVATNFLSKEAMVFESGLMVDAVRASISIPGVFAPFHHEGAHLVDGGVVNPVPVSVVEAMGAKAIIAVNLNSDSKQAGTIRSASEGDRENSGSSDEATQEQQNDLIQNLAGRYETLKNVLQTEVDDWIPDPTTGLNIFDVIGNCMNIMEQQVTQINFQTDQPDLLIEPDLMEFGIFDFHQAQPIMQRGYDAAKALLPQIKALSAPD
ncbi:MAG: patatin family protein [Leptolyngbyaceae cyanobacterium SM1_1_3]|nr:patatin family protein [Leptolyngbyaceae cyanobacterium SM1_1_3]